MTEDIGLLSAAFEAVGDHVALLDRRGTVVAVNEAWRTFARANGGREDAYLGHDYLAACRSAGDDPTAAACHEALSALLDGRGGAFDLEYPCHAPGEHRWFALHAAPLGDPEGHALVVHQEVTARRSSEMLQRALLEITTVLLHDEADDETYQAVLDHAVTLVPSAQLGSILVRGSDDRFRFVASHGFDLAKLREVSLAEDELHLQARQGENRTSYIVHQIDALNLRRLDARRLEVLRSAGATRDIAAALGVPIRSDGKMAALFSLDKLERVDAFSETDRRLAEAIGAQAGLVLRQLEAQQNLAGAAARESFLRRLSDALRPLADPGEIEGAVARLALDHFGADRCYYCELEGGDVTIRRDASRGDLPSVAGTHPLDEMPVLGAVVAAGRTFTVHDVNVSELVDANLRRLCLELEVVAFIDVPVIKNGRPAGIFCLTQRRPRAWTEAETALVTEIAERAWGALERARIENALRRSEQSFRALVTASSEVVYRMSPDWSEMHTLHGRGFLADTEDPSRDWLQRYVPPDDQPRVSAAIEEAIRTKGTFELEHRVRRADGTLGWTFSRAVPMLDEAGEIREWFGAASDVTARKRNEEQLAQAIEEVLADASWFGRAVMERLAEIRSGAPFTARLADLTEREQQVLALLARGLDNAAIAERLGIARSTVRNYVSRVYGKLGVRSRAEAVVWARERGVVLPE